MHFLYIFLGDYMFDDASGVKKKIISKVEHLNKQQIKVSCISFSERVHERTHVGENFIVLPIQKIESRKFLNSLIASQKYYDALQQFLNINAPLYTGFIFRYPLASKHLLNVVKKYPHKFVFEHNTKEIDEIKNVSGLLRKQLPFSFKPGYFIYNFETGFLNAAVEKYYGKKIFRQARFGLSVTKEIAEYEQSRCGTYKNYVVTNGIDVAQCQLREFRDYDKKTLHLFMLYGSPSTWHGVDKIIEGLKNYYQSKKSDVVIKVDLIGNASDEMREQIIESGMQNYIQLIPSMQKEELNEKLHRYHIGIGTMAAYRKGLKEATPLKLRDYLARGFPVVVGYTDTDLETHKEFDSYSLKVETVNSPLDFNAVLQFANKVYENKNHHNEIRKLAITYLDSDVKMKQMADILIDNFNSPS